MSRRRTTVYLEKYTDSPTSTQGHVTLKTVVFFSPFAYNQTTDADFVPEQIFTAQNRIHYAIIKNSLSGLIIQKIPTVA
jgi:hypothetical protein